MLDRRQALLAFTSVGAAVAPRPFSMPDPDAWRDCRAMAEALIRDRLTPGLQITVAQGPDLLFDAAFGDASLELGVPLTTSHVMRIGSASKQFTAALILRLAELGLLSIDDPLSRFLPTFPRASELTLARLLDHTAGLGNYTDDGNMDSFLRESRIDRSPEEFLAFLAASPTLQKHEPGTAWFYSNTGYVLLGVVAAQVTGQPLDAAMRGHLFVPAGLAATAADHAPDVVVGRVAGYTNLKQGGGFDNAAPLSLSYVGAAGVLRSTTRDLCRWQDALFGGRILAPGTLDRMLQPATLATGAPTLDFGGPVRYGCGVFLPADTPGAPRIVNHTGGIHGFSAYVGTNLDTRVAVATLANTDGGFYGPNDLRRRMTALRTALRVVAERAVAAA